MDIEFQVEAPSTVRVKFGDQEVVLTPEEFSDMAMAFGNARARFGPAIAAEFEAGQTVHDAIVDPRWRTEPEALNGDTLLHIRDPRFGWLHYLIPRAEAAKLATWVTRQVETPAPKLGTHQ